MTRPRIRAPDPEEAAALEVQHHLAEVADRLVAQGMDPDDARREAERRFGDPRWYRRRLEQAERKRRAMRRRTEVREVVIEGLAQSVRTMRRSPGFAAGVVLTLALGVGANAAMFGILDRLLLQPPTHVVDHERVVRVMLERPYGDEIGRTPLGAFPNYLDLKGHTGIASLAAWTGPWEHTLGRGPDATRVQVTQASHEFFPLLGVEPALGRFYGPDEDRIGAPPTAVVSHEFWRRALGSETTALGTVLVISGSPYTVVGVAPPGFTGIELSPVDVWLPIEPSQAILAGSDGWRDNRDYLWVDAVARLADGATVEAASETATALHRNAMGAQIQSGRYPAEARISFDPLIRARGAHASAESKVARWLGGVSLVVLLIACANVANLLLAQGTERRREVAVRLALGVGRGRLIVQTLLETVVLALVAGAVAVLLAAWGSAAIRGVLLPGVHFPDAVVSPRLVAFTLVAAGLAGAAAALGPAFQGARGELAGDLSMGAGANSTRRSRTRALLTVAQAALSVVLLVGAGLFVRSVAEVRSLDLGLDADRLLLASLELEIGGDVDGPRADGLSPAAETRLRNEIHHAAILRLQDVPGVEGVVGTSSPLLHRFSVSLKVPGWDSVPRVPGGVPSFQAVTPGYLETVGLQVERGRGLRKSDGPGDPKVTVVSETMARMLWPNGDALGKVMSVGNEEEPFTVVGVVEDASRGHIRGDAFMVYYVSIDQFSERRLLGLYVRSSRDLSEVSQALAPVLRAIDPRVRYASVRSLREILDPQTRSWTLGATLFTVFGLLALLVAIIGLYSVLAFDVAQRTRELGIRTALGAGKRQLLRSVVASGVRLAGVGVALGLGAALVAGPYVNELLFEVSPRDPAVLGTVSLALIAAAVIASLLPGLRATRVDPMVALRSE